jgi:hypothetical protein
MRQNITLTITSLLALALMSVHLTQDIMRGVDDPKGMKVGVLILVVWLCGIVLLAGRWQGYALTLLGGLFAAAMPVLHTMTVSPVKSGFFFVWTLYACGVTGTFAFILSVLALWKTMRLARSERPPADDPR